MNSSDAHNADGVRWFQRRIDRLEAQIDGLVNAVVEATKMADGTPAVSPDAPDLIDLVRELRQALGMSSAATAVSPKKAWEAAIDVARRLAGNEGVDDAYGRDDFFEDREATERRAAENDWGQRG